MLTSNWHDDILKFWFSELSPKQWFISTPDIDNTIQQRFESFIGPLADSSPHSLATDPNKLLAAIIVLDQFPRNIYRGSHMAFTYDSLALDLSKKVISHEFDQTMTDSERHFCYMPYMHAENIESQDEALTLFTQLGVKGGIDAAIEHREIIVQFGRFPHRNEVLGRQSTPAEVDYLANAKRFGQ